MPRQKEYWDLYADHCIRHPKDAVSYGNFRWRVRNWGERLAVRLGKQESAPEMARIRKEKRDCFLNQKRAQEKKHRWLMLARVLLGILLLGIGIVIGTTM